MTMDAVYQLDGARAIKSAHAVGPWSATMQHGAAPTALVAWGVENMESRQPMQVARLTIDLLRPVPVAPLASQSPASAASSPGSVKPLPSNKPKPTQRNSLPR